MKTSACTFAAGLFLAIGCAFLLAQTTQGSDKGADAPAGWPGWRGPTGCGNADEGNLPVSWGGKENANVLWKAALPKSAGISPSSPIVVGDSVIVTTSIDKVPIEHYVTCFSLKDGSLRWLTPVQPGPIKQIDGRASSAAPTPCTDGQYVFAMFGSGVIAAADLKDGKEKWRQELPKDTAFDCVIGNSPVVYGGNVLLVADQYKGKSAVYAWDCKTGELKFQEKRPKDDFCHTTPIFIKVEGKDQMIVAANKGLQGLDPLTGKTLWWATYGAPNHWMGETASPVFGAGLIYVDNGRGDGGASFKPGGAGNATKENLKATFACKSDVGSPIIVGEFAYRNIGDRVQCMKLQTGEIVYTQQLKGIHAWASPVATADRIYYATAGRSYVFKAGPKFELLGEGDLGDNNPASPAAADGKLFLKGAKFLWCVREKVGGDLEGAIRATPAPPPSAAQNPAAAPASAPDGEKGKWVVISDETIKRLQADGKKVGWPGGGGTAGVAVDRTTGDVYMVLSDNGLWKSKDRGATFERVDSGKVGGRAETGFAIDVDPNGKRIMCSMVYGPSAMILDSGASAVKSGVTHLDCGAVDWTDGKTLIAIRHESGGMACISRDGGTTWKDIGKAFARIGVFDAKTFVAARGKEPGILRSEDGGATWSKVSDLVPAGLSMKVFKGVGYWTSKGGLLVSKDKGATWAVQGTPVECSVGPLFGKDEKHLVVAGKEGLMETADGGETWKVAVPYPENVKYADKGWYPFSIKFNPGGSFGNYAWDPQGDVFYASAIGQPTWKYQR